jgi:hypothetical protein
MRRLFNFLIIASLVLSLAGVGWWLRSRSTREGLYLHAGSWLWTVDSALGEFAVGYYRNAPGGPRLHYRASEPNLYAGLSPDFEYLPLLGDYGRTRVLLRDGVVDLDPPKSIGQRELTDDELSAPLKYAHVTLPHWSLVVSFALLPLIRLVAMTVRSAKTRKRRARGVCLICGYDRRASPGRCPECGSPDTPLPGGVAEA